MKKLIFLFTLILCCFNAHAESTNFDFYLGRYLVDRDEEVKVNFIYDLENFDDNNFLVRPVIENGLVEIFNISKNSWVSPFSVISDLPFLKKEMLIKIKGFEIEKTYLNFQIFNTSTGDIYTTPKESIWSKKIYSNYLEKVNEKVFGNAVSKSDGEVSDINYLDYAQISPYSKSSYLDNVFDKLSEEFSYFISLIMFLSFFFIGFKKKSKENEVRKSLDTENRIYGVNGKIH